MWRRAVSQISKQVPWKAATSHQSPTPLGSSWQVTTHLSNTSVSFFSTQEQQQPKQNSGYSTPNAPTPDQNKQETSTPYTEAASNPENEHIEEIRQYHRFTDIYLGGLWNRLESQLGNIENSKSDFDYDVQLTSGCMRVKLPTLGNAEVVICKDPQEQGLKVESNLLGVYGSDEGSDPREEVNFKFQDDVGDFVNINGGGEALHQFLEHHLEKHLQVELDLEPQPGPHDKVYGADPT